MLHYIVSIFLFSYSSTLKHYRSLIKGNADKLVLTKNKLMKSMVEVFEEKIQNDNIKVAIISVNIQH